MCNTHQEALAGSNSSPTSETVKIPESSQAGLSSEPVDTQAVQGRAEPTTPRPVESQPSVKDQAQSPQSQSAPLPIYPQTSAVSKAGLAGEPMRGPSVSLTDTDRDTTNGSHAPSQEPVLIKTEAQLSERKSSPSMAAAASEITPNTAASSPYSAQIAFQSVPPVTLQHHLSPHMSHHALQQAQTQQAQPAQQPLAANCQQDPQGQQCYCLMPVPSGLSHAPFIYQCVPISPNMAGALPPNVSVVRGTPGQIPSPVPIVGPQLAQNASVVGGIDPHTPNGVHTIATALAQMKSAQHDGIQPQGPPLAMDPRSPVPSATSPLTGSTAAEEEKPRPHACKMQDNWGRTCKRTFTRPYDLYRHQETVHGSGTKSFCCGMCGCKSKKFSRQDSLARHIRRMHRMVDPLEIRDLVATSATPSIREASLSYNGPAEPARESQASPAGYENTHEHKAATLEPQDSARHTDSIYDTESDSSNDTETRELSESRPKRLKTGPQVTVQPV